LNSGFWILLLFFPQKSRRALANSGFWILLSFYEQQAIDSDSGFWILPQSPRIFNTCPQILNFEFWPLSEPPNSMILILNSEFCLAVFHLDSAPTPASFPNSAQNQTGESRAYDSDSEPGPRSGFWILDSGFWILDSGFQVVLLYMPGQSLDSGFWILDSGFWILDFGFLGNPAVYAGSKSGFWRLWPGRYSKIT